MKKIVTINEDYAIKVYCHIFGREDTKGDAYIQGVFDALKTLPERERFALEYRFRDGLTYKQIGEKFGFGARTGSAYNSARFEKDATSFKGSKNQRRQDNRVEFRQVFKGIGGKGSGHRRAERKDKIA